jgi:succinoglycan biosynthesis transport protein ExoP
MKHEQTGMSIEQTLAVLRRRGLWILLCVVLVAGPAYGLSKRQTKKYTATAAVAFNSSPLSQQIAGLSSNVGNSNSSVLAQEDNNLELVKLGNTSEKAARLLGHGLTAEKISASLSISGRGESDVVDIAATSTSPILAAAIANTYTRQFVKEQQNSNRRFFKSALALVNNQLARLSPTQRFGADGLDLEDRAHTLSLLAELGYNNAQVAQEAAIPSSPSSPKVSRNTSLGLVLGLLLGIGIAVALERLDRRIRTPGDLEQLYGLPLLGAIPKSAALSRSAGDKRVPTPLPPADAEVFGLIRAHLRFYNIDRDMRTILIASPAPQDGRTTIARHLADAAARSGSRALLLEADLRRPTIAQQLGVQAGPGLADVLIGDATIDRATHSIGTAGTLERGMGGHTHDILTAGAVLPPNPGELLESPAMYALLDQASTTYDLVVIDTSPLVAVSDAFPLLTKVDGVIIVGRIGRSRRDAAEELQRVLASSGAPLLGIIANGTKSSGFNSYARQVDRGAPPAAASSHDPSSSEEFVPIAKA